MRACVCELRAQRAWNVCKLCRLAVIFSDRDESELLDLAEEQRKGLWPDLPGSGLLGHHAKTRRQAATTYNRYTCTLHSFQPASLDIYSQSVFNAVLCTLVTQQQITAKSSTSRIYLKSTAQGLEHYSKPPAGTWISRRLKIEPAQSTCEISSCKHR